MINSETADLETEDSEKGNEMENKEEQTESIENEIKKDESPVIDENTVTEDADQTMAAEDNVSGEYGQAEEVFGTARNETPEQKSDNAPTPTAAELPPVVNYVWSYADQVAADRAETKKDRRRGALTYAVIMTALFVICLGLLITVIATGLNRTFAEQKIVYKDRTVYVKEEPDDDDGVLSISEVADKVTPSVVGISVTVNQSGLTGTGVGTGVIYDDSGYIITNYHVVEDADKITVVLHDKKRLVAEYVGGDALSDIAVLKVDYEGLKPASFGDSDSLIVGERAIAIGNPSGLDFAGTVTVGYISAVSRNIKIYDVTGYLEKRMYLIQTDASLNPGNSGGPLVDIYGKVIGINTMKLVDTEGIGFSIPINSALVVVKEIISTGKYTGNAVADTGVSLGISCISVTKDMPVSGTTVNAPETGIYVASVDSTRSSYGYLEEGDVITAIDGIPVELVEELRDILFDHYSGDTVALKVYRNGAVVDVNIPLK